MSTHSHAMRHAPIRNGRSKFPRIALATQEAQKFRYVLVINNGVNDTLVWLRAVVGCSPGGNTKFCTRNVTFFSPELCRQTGEAYAELNITHQLHTSD
jgi:hypothetical protein